MNHYNELQHGRKSLHSSKEKNIALLNGNARLHRAGTQVNKIGAQSVCSTPPAIFTYLCTNQLLSFLIVERENFL